MSPYVCDNNDSAARLPVVDFEPVTLELYSGGSDLVDGGAVSMLMSLFSRRAYTCLKVYRGDVDKMVCELSMLFSKADSNSATSPLVVAAGREDSVVDALGTRGVDVAVLGDPPSGTGASVLVVTSAYMREDTTGGAAMVRWLCATKPRVVVVVDCDNDLKGVLVHPVARAADIIEDSVDEGGHALVNCVACLDSGVVSVGATDVGDTCECNAGAHLEGLENSTRNEEAWEEFRDHAAHADEEYERGLREYAGCVPRVIGDDTDWTPVRTPDLQQEPLVMVCRLDEVVMPYDSLCPTCYSLGSCTCEDKHGKQAGGGTHKGDAGKVGVSEFGACAMVQYDPSGVLRRRPSLAGKHPSDVRFFTMADDLVFGLVPTDRPLIVFPVPMRLSVSMVMGAVWLDPKSRDVVHGCLVDNIAQGDVGVVEHGKVFNDTMAYTPGAWKRIPTLIRNALRGGAAPYPAPSFPALGTTTFSGCMGEHFSALATSLVGVKCVRADACATRPLVLEPVSGGVYEPAADGALGVPVLYLPPAASWHDASTFLFGRLVSRWLSNHV